MQSRSNPSALDRRSLIKSAGATAALAALGFAPEALAQQGLKLGQAENFSFDALKTRAKELAAQPYAPPPPPPADILERIDYDAHGKIKFKPEMALWANGPSPWPVTFFHLGRYFRKPVRMHVLDAGKAREIVYDESYFEMPADSPARQLPDGAGFAGFRFQESRFGHPGRRGEKLDWQRNDWVAFLGASYFRAIGELYQYGLSARGLAIDPAVAGKAEEFPDFTHVWLETPQEASEYVVVYALLSGPSVAGAYRFRMHRGKGVSMEIETALYLRNDIARLGITPLTSMYWYSETAKTTAIDWRPEVHDSDGLALWTGTGERAWRPLNNPSRAIASAFRDENPRGFGLMQRDRLTDHYMDGVFYERRPSLWVETTGDWGRGAVQLIELPTDDEIHDNIVAMWVPEGQARAGDSYEFRYKLHWLADEPFPPALGRVVATRLGNGGQPGTIRPRGVRKFMVEFKGPALENIPTGLKPEVVLSASRGTFSYVFAEAVPNDVPGHWRAQFDLTADGSDPVEMRCFLRGGDTVLTETWLFQYLPF
ncbi:glucan biosynthesis protein D [Bosea caraganae]|uniref:Glucan biosynthesis protein D n=1 Tax=Bosea caraganae TaxID=2763117 RepID=A0A370LA40_9HYPH|nr:glucan biosynthesis protein D [Bosea caraganae]RDJ21782.1 glucan biosynthesis protein D [Bosea caraganae]RDJ28188.1 glucan biosynthesis protein D [Bosea caraganae]